MESLPAVKFGIFVIDVAVSTRIQIYNLFSSCLTAKGRTPYSDFKCICDYMNKGTCCSVALPPGLSASPDHFRPSVRILHLFLLVICSGYDWSEEADKGIQFFHLGEIDE